MSQSVADFVDSVTACGLLADGELSAASASDADPGRFAADLVERGLLTRFQAKHVLAGKADLLKIDGYVLLDKIGEGGMGAVYRARHQQMDRIVALKTLKVGRSGKHRQGALDRFRREVKVAAKLVHPNIVTAFDAGVTDRFHYLVMEYVAGCDLGARVKQQGPIGWRVATEIIIQAARGIGHAHACGVIHRDIKPGNLLCDAAGCIKVLDLGLARLGLEETQEGEDQLTVAGQIMGTPDFMAPEQAIDATTCSVPADIYSLGCTLYAITTGGMMYAASSAIAKLMAHRNNPIPSLAVAPWDVPGSIDRAYQKMVAKNPTDRFQSMDEAIAAFEKALADIDSNVYGLQEPQNPPEMVQTALEFPGSCDASQSIPLGETPFSAVDDRSRASSTSRGSRSVAPKQQTTVSLSRTTSASLAATTTLGRSDSLIDAPTVASGSSSSLSMASLNEHARRKLTDPWHWARLIGGATALLLVALLIFAPGGSPEQTSDKTADQIIDAAPASSIPPSTNDQSPVRAPVPGQVIEVAPERSIEL
jgi:serine/threonine protein kinase